MKNRRKSISYIYLWLLPILSVPVLYGIKNNSDLVVYLLSVLVHLGLLAWCIRGLRPAGQTESNGKVHFVSALLLFGATGTFISATTFPTTDLAAISADKFGHYWTSAGFFISELLFLAGMDQLNVMIYQRGIRMHKFGYLLLLTGGTLWLVHLSFRLSAMTWAADQKSLTGSIPDFYEMAVLWSGSLYAAYMALSYLGFIAYGLAFKRSGLFPGWLSTATLIFGIVSPILFATGIGPFRMPIVIQIMPWLIGIYLIKRTERKSFAV